MATIEVTGDLIFNIENGTLFLIYYPNNNRQTAMGDALYKIDRPQMWDVRVVWLRHPQDLLGEETVEWSKKIRIHSGVIAQGISVEYVSS
jgi:hypothetical protein